MSHFAKIEGDIVTNVIVAEQEHIDTLDGTWLKTSYNTSAGKHPNNTPLRKNFAGIGFTYDSTRDAFYNQQPYPSWVLNETTCKWEAPISIPSDDKRYEWNEETTNWKEVS
jgi:hypothetical protein